MVLATNFVRPAVAERKHREHQDGPAKELEGRLRVATGHAGWIAHAFERTLGAMRDIACRNFLTGELFSAQLDEAWLPHGWLDAQVLPPEPGWYRLLLRHVLFPARPIEVSAYWEATGWEAIELPEVFPSEHSPLFGRLTLASPAQARDWCWTAMRREVGR